MSEELKPCPFCGSDADLGYDSGNEVWGQKWWARCLDKTCGATGPAFMGTSTWDRDSRESRKQDEKAKADAAAWWNRRA